MISEGQETRLMGSHSNIEKKKRKKIQMKSQNGMKKDEVGVVVSILGVEL
jgi:hypothetical protein